MAARSPRKTFANPFVVTIVALPAVVTACNPPPPQQPQPPDPQPQVVTEPPATPAPTDPPPTEPAQAGGAPATYNFDQRWTVSKTGDTCMAMARVECPKPKNPKDPVPTCNPPPPMKMAACPDGWDGKEAITVVQYANQTECMIEPKPVKCPPNVACNPPPPRKVACPTYQ